MKGTESSLCIVTMCLRERKEEREREMGVRDAMSFRKDFWEKLHG